MSKVAYSGTERRQIRQALIEAALTLFAKQGIQHTSVAQIYEQVGISRTFFYSFFPSKEDLVVEALYCQQPKILEHAHRLMSDPTRNWREQAESFLYGCFSGSESRFAIMSMEEQQAVYRCLSEKNYQAFLKRQERLFTELLEIFHIRAQRQDVLLCGQMLAGIIVLRRAVPDSLPFFSEEVADRMVRVQTEALLDLLETLRDCSGPL